MWLLTLTLASLISLLEADQIPDVTSPLPEYYHPIESLYHSQTNAGHYVYGYKTPSISKTESRTTDGVTYGGYSYIDSLGHLQTVQYTADPKTGFRVSASNLPVEADDVIEARAAHLAAYQANKAQLASFNPSSVTQVAEQPNSVTDLPEVVQARAEHLALVQEAYRKAQEAQLGYGLPLAPQPVKELPEVVKARNEHLAAVQKELNNQAQLKAQIAVSPVPRNGYVVPIKVNVKADSLPVTPQAKLSYSPDYSKFKPYLYGYVGSNSAKSESQVVNGTGQ
ncbi:hypothetical protein ABEB36_008940 [Hypothenemus hampei]|uniref:Cuticle protein 6 n=1 Tax=Hypothenemus hampei TaxID=57062 RepID=A0ABD1EP49_HYPHA